MVITGKRLAVILSAALLLAALIWSAYYASNVYTVAVKCPLRMGLAEQPKTLDPARVETHAEKLAASAMYEPLLRYDQDSQTMKPHICRNWGYSRDGKKVIFMLARDVSFHNGRHLKAADIKASWERSLKNAGNETASDLFSDIAGARSFSHGAASEITGLKAVNDYTLEVTLHNPDSAFVYKITHPVFWVVDASDPVACPSGTGPFVLKSMDKTGMTMERFNRYHSARPGLSGLIFRFYASDEAALAAYRAGELEYLDSVPNKEVPGLMADQRIREQVVKKPVLAFYALAINVRQHPFHEVELRRAMNYYIDRDALISAVMGGVGRPCKGVIPQGLHGYNRALQGYSYNPERAFELLSESTYPYTRSTQSIKFYYNAGAGHERVSDFIKTQMEMLNINLLPLSLEWEAYRKKLTGMQMPIFRVTWEADYPDPDGFLYPLFHSSQVGRTNVSGYRNPKVDNILDAARAQTASSQERIRLLRRAEQIIIDDAPMVWLFQKETVKLVSPRVTGFKMDGMELIDWSALSLRD